MSSGTSTPGHSGLVSFEDNAVIIVFGASGDLAKKKTVSAQERNGTTQNGRTNGTEVVA